MAVDSVVRGREVEGGVGSGSILFDAFLGVWSALVGEACHRDDDANSESYCCIHSAIESVFNFLRIRVANCDEIHRSTSLLYMRQSKGKRERA